MLQVFLRKVISTYIATCALVLGIPLLSNMLEGGGSYLVNDFLGWIAVSGMIAFPVILIYGSVGSIALEFGLPKLISKRWALIVVQGIGHILLGALFAVLISVDWFMYVTAITAFIYFLTDQLLIRLKDSKHRKKVWIALFALPIVIVLVTVALLPPAEEQTTSSTPFTKEDAVAFVTKSDSTTTGIFPNKIGEITVTIDGYSVSRETKVTELDNEKYEVLFVESWKKGDEKGERQLSYVVTWDRMEHNSSGGDTPPFS